MMVLMFLLYDIQGVPKGHQNSINGPYFFPLQKIGKIHKVLRKSHQESYQLKICTIKNRTLTCTVSVLYDTILFSRYDCFSFYICSYNHIGQNFIGFPSFYFEKANYFSSAYVHKQGLVQSRVILQDKMFLWMLVQVFKERKSHIIRCRYIPDLKDLQTQNDYGFPCHTKC